MTESSPTVVHDYMGMIKFSHSIFALPFGLISLLVATDGAPGLMTLIYVVLAMVAARSAAMAYNRYADREIDAINPRTAMREIPAGRIRPAAALAFTFACCAVFIWICALLGTACLWLSVPVLFVLLGYSHAKRFTSLAHLWLGFALGLAPPAAWVAARGEFEPELWNPILLGAGVMVWVGGFDILYACQDEAFDRAQGLHSVPVRFGRRGSLWMSRGLHLLAVLAFFAFGYRVELGWPYHLGVAVAGALLLFEHRTVRVDDLSRINMAFFTMNGLVSVAMLGFTALDLYLL